MKTPSTQVPPAGFAFGLQVPDAPDEAEAVRFAAVVLHPGASDEVLVLPGHEAPPSKHWRDRWRPWTWFPEGYTVYVRRRGARAGVGGLPHVVRAVS